jgi:hypothetical protein
MAKKHDAFRLGLTVILIFVLFFAVVLFLGRGWQTGERTRFTVLFPHTLNLPLLEEGGDVLAYGQIVGTILSLDSNVPDDKGTGKAARKPTLCLKVTAEVKKEVGLREDCRIVAEGPVLGGRGYLRITDRGSSEKPIDPNVPVYGGASGFSAAVDALTAEIDERNPQSLMAQIKHELNPEDVTSLTAKLHRSMDDLNTLTRAVAVQMNPAEKDALVTKLGSILDNLNLTTGYLRGELTPGREGVALAKVQAALDALNQGLAETVAMLQENRPHVTSALASVDHAAATVDTGIAGPIARELDTTNPEGLLAQVHDSFGKLNRSLADLNVVSDKGRTLIVLNEQRFDRLMANVKETSDHLKAAAKDLRRNPWRLLYRPGPEETRQADILDAARAFSEAAGLLDDSATQLQALAASRGGEVPEDDPTLAELRAKLQATFEKFQTAEQTLWKQLKP